MSEDHQIPENRVSEFFEKALAAGVPYSSLTGLLAAQGWREKDAYRALGTHIRNTLGIDVPRRSSAGASAKDAFFYLLIFATLATWTVNLGSLAFQLIERWLADPLFTRFQEPWSKELITWSLASILVAYPLYLLISRAVLRDVASDPEKLDSGIRKWLTYMALVVAASIFMGDLICALAFLLRGEITSRFLAKSFVVLVLSGGVFFYYFGGLRNTDAAKTSFARDRWMAGLSSAAVVLMLVLGFLQLGPPRTQRDLRADAQRVQQLYQLGEQVENYWKSHPSQLPASLDSVSGAKLDPVTRARYEYHSGQGSQYELCADFAQPSPSDDNRPDSGIWSHPAGHHCFSLDASTPMTYPSEDASF
jgi:hypothetical protein